MKGDRLSYLIGYIIKTPKHCQENKLEYSIRAYILYKLYSGKYTIGKSKCVLIFGAIIVFYL